MEFCIMPNVMCWRYVYRTIDFLLTLILGGNRSGKSRYAELCAVQSKAEQVYYVATAMVKDAEMRQRIIRHRQHRPEQWITLETPVHLAHTIKQYAQPDCCLLVDCLTLWLSNLMFDAQGAVQDEFLNEQIDAMCQQLQILQSDVILVSNEIGSGVIPMDSNTRRFVDELGLLHQRIAAIADRVVLVTAGLPQVLKPCKIG